MVIVTEDECNMSEYDKLAEGMIKDGVVYEDDKCVVVSRPNEHTKVMLEVIAKSKHYTGLG